METITFWTARLAMALFFLALALRFGLARLAEARLAWTLGWMANVVHVAWSLGVVHGWSQQAAFDETARRTAETVGFGFGGGLYVNYIFLLVWGADVTYWWIAGLESYEHRRTWIEWCVLAFLAFIVFNATVVFATGFSRWLGIVGCVVLPLAWCYGRACRRAQAS